MRTPPRHLVVIALATLACVSCVPLPMYVPTASHGFTAKRIDKEALEFIQIGTTTREEVLLRLGAPDYFDDADELLFVYRTEFIRGYFSVLFLTPFGVGGGHKIPHRGEALVSISFDENGRVIHVERR